jgi:N-methylhydantoinase A
LITTKGFEDLIFIGRQNRPELYNFSVEKPKEIIKRRSCFGISERTLADGTIYRFPKRGEVEKLNERFMKNHIASVAICFLHAYANPKNEQTVGKWLRDLELPVYLSSQVLPEFREYERMSTTLINAYISPVLSQYMQALAGKLKDNILRIQKSNGGTLSIDRASEKAIHTILSGPAGGLVGAFRLAQIMGESKIITLDMGGTSTDVALCDGQLPYTKEYQLDGYPIGVPVLDIHTVGAGGGSIAHIDRGGALKVGPESAGAFPGPVCYGEGERLTVTDAHLFLQRILPEFFLDGKMSIYPGRTEEKMLALSEGANLLPTDLALGIIQVANASMVKAMRAVSLEKGYDPREFTLFCFGGTSGLHACELADELGITRIVVPREAAVLSALGMILTEPTAEYSQTIFLGGEDLTKGELSASFNNLIQKGYKELKRDGLLPEGLSYQLSLDMRYKGQSYEITMRYTPDFMDDFHERHQHLFGHHFLEKGVEITTLRVTFKVQTKIPEIRPKKTRRGSAGEALLKGQEVAFSGGKRKIPVFTRERLAPGIRITGPALIVDRFSTVLVTKGFDLGINEYDSVVLDRR